MQYPQQKKYVFFSALIYAAQKSTAANIAYRACKSSCYKNIIVSRMLLPKNQFF